MRKLIGLAVLTFVMLVSFGMKYPNGRNHSDSVHALLYSSPFNGVFIAGLMIENKKVENEKHK